MNDKKDIKSLSLDELNNYIKQNRYPSYRAKQLFSWMHKNQVDSFDKMTNLPKDMISFLNENCTLRSIAILKKLVSQIDGTIKYLFRLSDNELVETVLMRYNHGVSVCVSTQVGCKMGCSFCASTKAGFIRNLTASEILNQVYAVQNDTGERVSNIVLMGIGEPLDNFSNVISFLKLISDPNGNNLSMRHISLSTCGVVDEIYKLADLKLQITLSVSLHAANDQTRSETMPINNKFNISELIKACKYYTNITSRRISFEYALIDGVNDSIEDAKELSTLLKGMLCHVNLIPVNSIKERDYKKSGKENIKRFCDYMNDHRITTTVRRTLGSDINAACGQLRREHME